MNTEVPKLTPWLKFVKCKMHVWFCLIDWDLFVKEEVCFEATKPGCLCILKGLLSALFQRNSYQVKFGEVIWSDQKTTFTNSFKVLHNNCLVERKEGG